MVKIRNILPRPFNKVSFFPGCAGNPFDRLLHSLEKIERLPVVTIPIALALLALLGGLPAWLISGTLPVNSALLILFFLGDWLLISRLPSTQRSFGPTRLTVLMLACLRAPFGWLPWGWTLGFEIAGTLLVIYGFFIEPFYVEVRRETFVTNKWTPDQTISMLHLGDLHLERTTRREKQILALIHDLSPDVILFSGDVLNLSFLQDPIAQAQALEFFSQLSAPLGVFGVSGSPAVDHPDFMARLSAETPLQWLDNSVANLRGKAKFSIWGLTCSHNPDLDSEILEKIQTEQNFEKTRINLLLYHSPDLAPHSCRLGFDLQLSGHTHGGQVRLPFIGALYAGSLYGKLFEAGRYLVNGMTLFVTRGLGLEGAAAPRVRFLCRPEITLWQIQGKSSDNGTKI